MPAKASNDVGAQPLIVFFGILDYCHSELVEEFVQEKFLPETDCFYSCLVLCKDLTLLRQKVKPRLSTIREIAYLDSLQRHLTSKFEHSQGMRNKCKEYIKIVLLKLQLLEMTNR